MRKVEQLEQMVEVHEPEAHDRKMKTGQHSDIGNGDHEFILK